jgi:hypothetical protein
VYSCLYPGTKRRKMHNTAEISSWFSSSYAHKWPNDSSMTIVASKGFLFELLHDRFSFELDVLEAFEYTNDSISG